MKLPAVLGVDSPFAFGVQFLPLPDHGAIPDDDKRLAVLAAPSLAGDTADGIPGLIIVMDDRLHGAVHRFQKRGPAIQDFVRLKTHDEKYTTSLPFVLY